jgi:hypothetical protein
LYGALVAKDEKVFLSLKDRIDELSKVGEYGELYKSLMLQAKKSFKELELYFTTKGV